MTKPDALPELIESLARERFRPLYVRITDDGRVMSCFGDPAFYGYDDIINGGSADSLFDLIHGIAADEPVEMPFVQTPNGRSATVRIKAGDDCREIIFYDTTAERDQRQELQQKSNELAMLSIKQKELMDQLQQTNEELEVKRREAEDANRLKSRFIANMSHEFRTPLSSIIAYSELPDSSALSTGTGNRDAAIERAAKHLMALVENLLEQAQLEIGESKINLQATNVRQLIEEMTVYFSPLFDAKKLDLSVCVQPGVPAGLLLDPLRIRQILINLLGNACKYTLEGGVRLEAGYENGWLTITVKDSGPGMDRETLDNVFVPFHRAEDLSQSGAGLGLSITRRLLDLMHGEIDVKLMPGAGTSIRFQIPCESVEINHVDDGLDRANGDRVVLVVEDDANVFEIIAVNLENAGYRAVHQSSASGALAVYRSVAPDVVLLDLQLPDMDGCTLAAALRDDGFTNPIVMLTASSLQSDRQRALASGCTDLLVKPVMPSELVRTLRLFDGISSKDRLRHLQASFRRSLYERADELARCLAQGDDQIDLEALGQLLHKIGGAAAFYGMQDLSDHAEGLRRYIEEDFADSESTGNAISGRLEALIALIRDAAGTPDASGADGEASQVRVD